jgi:hypothetical protein
MRRAGWDSSFLYRPAGTLSAMADYRQRLTANQNQTSPACVESATGELVLRAGSSAAAVIAAGSVEHTLTAAAVRPVFEGPTEIPEPHTPTNS